MHLEARPASGTEMELKEKLEGRGEKENNHQETVSLGRSSIRRVPDCSLSPERKTADPGIGRGKEIFFEGGDHEGN